MSGAGEVLERRALNRALLARQGLLRRWELPALEAVERLVGMQAQAPFPPYFGLWTRVAGFRAQELGEALLDRRVVRASLLRGTIHLVSARDCLFLRPLLQPMLARFLGGIDAGRQMAGMDLGELIEVGREMLEERPRTNAELGRALGARWPGRDEGSLAQVVQYLVPTVQIPPRGVWGQAGQATWATIEGWLGRPVESEPSVDALVRRYLGAFGPASVADAQKWSGMPGLKAIFERLRPELVTFQDERGRELFDLPEAPRPDAATPAPVRFLPEFDNVLLAHVDRTRIISDANRARVFTINGIIRATVLVDGFVRGTWTIERERGVATLLIEPFAPLSTGERDDVVGEGLRLLGSAAADAAHDVRFVESSAVYAVARG